MTRRSILTLLIAAAGAAAPEMAAAQATATHYGDTAACVLQSTDTANNVNRLICKFMPVSNTRNLRIEYMSGACVTTQYGLFSVKQFQIVTIPNGAATVPYQLPVNKNATGNIFMNGSYTFSSTQTTIYANSGTPLYALVDLILPLPDPQFVNNIKQCTVSLSGMLILE